MTEWGPWIEHDGKGCPVSAGTFLHVVAKDGTEQFGFMGRPDPGCSYFDWVTVIAKQGCDAKCIVRYRIRKSRGLQILESILSEVDAPVREVTV